MISYLRYFVKHTLIILINYAFKGNKNFLLEFILTFLRFYDIMTWSKKNSRSDHISVHLRKLT